MPLGPKPSALFSARRSAAAPRRCLIKDFELRPNVLDLLLHHFIRRSVGREKILQKQLIELIDLNQQMGAIEKTRYHVSVCYMSYGDRNNHCWVIQPGAAALAKPRPHRSILL